MQGPPLILLELGLGLVMIGWGVWELVSLRRDRKRREREAARSATPRHPER